jgi:hypothetical protein
MEHSFGETQIKEVHDKTDHSREILKRHQPVRSNLNGRSRKLLIVNHFIRQIWNGFQEILDFG